MKKNKNYEEGGMSRLFDCKNLAGVKYKYS